ncbi:MAG: hypothetical protein EB084_12375 [Proteobacteria bacterium]|nr:hypothetical protein [Pseudomonadota bacterium]
MLFSDPEFVKLLNSYCVTATINVYPVEAGDGVSTADADWVRANAPDLVPLLDQRIRLGPAVISPDWKSFSRIYMEHQNQMREASINGLMRIVDAHHVEKRPPVLKPSTRMPAGLAPTDLLLRLSARFLTPDQLEKPVAYRLPKGLPFRFPLEAHRGADDEVRSMYQLRLRAPAATKEWVVLPKQRCDALLPAPGAAVGQSWEIDAKTATELLWLVRPTTHQYRISREDVKSLRLRATLEGPNRVKLEGALRVRQYWFPTSDEGIWKGDTLVDNHWGETAVCGYLTFDATTRRVDALRLATSDAMYRGIDDTQLPFVVVAYSVNPQTVSREEHEDCAQPRRR